MCVLISRQILSCRFFSPLEVGNIIKLFLTAMVVTVQADEDEIASTNNRFGGIALNADDFVTELRHIPETSEYLRDETVKSCEATLKKINEDLNLHRVVHHTNTIEYFPIDESLTKDVINKAYLLSQKQIKQEKVEDDHFDAIFNAKSFETPASHSIVIENEHHLKVDKMLPEDEISKEYVFSHRPTEKEKQKVNLKVDKMLPEDNISKEYVFSHRPTEKGKQKENLKVDKMLPEYKISKEYVLSHGPTEKEKQKESLKVDKMLSEYEISKEYVLSHRPTEKGNQKESLKLEKLLPEVEISKEYVFSHISTEMGNQNKNLKFDKALSKDTLKRLFENEQLKLAKDEISRGYIIDHPLITISNQSESIQNDNRFEKDDIDSLFKIQHHPTKTKEDYLKIIEALVKEEISKRYIDDDHSIKIRIPYENIEIEKPIIKDDVSSLFRVKNRPITIEDHNRKLMEALFKDEINKVYLANHRPITKENHDNKLKFDESLSKRVITNLLGHRPDKTMNENIQIKNTLLQDNNSNLPRFKDSDYIKTLEYEYIPYDKETGKAYPKK